MRITYDKQEDIAYIYFVDHPEPGSAANTYVLTEDYNLDLKGDVNLDADKNGKLLGLELYPAISFLDAEVLNKAEIIG